ncbi:MAG TPA: GNAT family protein [Magnetospirillum sp.]|nr:GNAT family protein [Magnetospirillum sp.]
MKRAGLPSHREGAQVVGRILLYADQFVADWMAAQTGVSFDPPYTAFATIGADGQIAGAVLFNHLHERDVEVSLVAPRRMSRGLLRAAAAYAFDTLGCKRLTARTRASSLRVRRVIEKTGFRQEGVLRSYYQDGDDAILFGMLKTECRW